MAFMGIFMLFLLMVLAVLAVCTITAAVLFIIAFFAARKAKKQALLEGTEYKRPTRVLVLRVIGGVFMIPLIGVVGLILYAWIASAVKTRSDLALAVERYDFATAQRLLANGADPDRTLKSAAHAQNGEATLLVEVVRDRMNGEQHGQEERLEMAELLLKYGADVNAVCYDPGHEKDGECHYDGSEYMIYQVSDGCGRTPFLYAVMRGDMEMARLLEEHGADLYVKDYCGFNAVATAADNLDDRDGGVEILRYLTEKGVSCTEVTNFSQNAYWLAFRQVHNDGSRENEEMFAYLEEITGEY